MAVSAHDVFRRLWAWREITREEASLIYASSRVAVVSRPVGPAAEAEWFTPGNSYFWSWRPQTRASLRYFLLLEKPEMEQMATGIGELEGGKQNEAPEDELPPEEFERTRVE